MQDKVRILMADDNIEHLELCKEFLSKDRYELDAALDGCSALQKINTERYDLVVLDYRLPDMNGIEVLKRLRIVNKDVPVILVSAHDEPGLSLIAMKNGASDFIVKTFAYYRNLQSRIDENLEAHKRPKKS